MYGYSNYMDFTGGRQGKYLLSLSAFKGKIFDK
jgi:hypothetical protein